MPWNYRLVEVKTPHGVEVGVYEVYYDSNMNPTSRTENPCTLSGDTLDDVLGDWSMMEGAFKSDVLSDDLFSNGEEE